MEHETVTPTNFTGYTQQGAGRLRQTLIRALPALGLLLMLALVNYPLLSRDLWTDEAFSLSYTAHPTLGALLDDVRKNEETPPVYFVSIWLWSRAVGRGELAIRSASLLAGAAALVGFALMVRRRLSGQAAAVATLTMAATPLLQRYLVEARGYTLTVLLTVACIWSFERYYRRPERRADQLLYALCAAGLFLTSYFSIALLAAQWIAVLSRLRAPETRRERLVGWGIVHLIIAVCVVAWLPALRYQMLVSPAVTADWSSGLRDYYYMAFGSLMGDPGRGWQQIGWLIGAAAGFSLILAASLGQRETSGLLIRTLALPAALLFVMVLLLQVVATRYLIVLLPGSAIAVGVGFSALRRRRPWLSWSLLALLALGMLSVRLSAPPSDPKDAWAHLSAQVAAAADPASDLVLFHPPWDQRIFEYYYHGPALPMAGARHYDDFYYSQAHVLRQTWTTPEALQVIAGHRRVWVVYDQLHHQVPPLRLPYQQLGHWQEGRLELFLYAVSPP